MNELGLSGISNLPKSHDEGKNDDYGPENEEKDTHGKGERE